MSDYLKIKSGVQIGGPNSPITLRVIDTSAFFADSSSLASVLAIESYVQSRNLSYFADTSAGNPTNKQIMLYNSSTGKWTATDTLDVSISNYVLKTGDTMTGNLNVDASIFIHGIEIGKNSSSLPSSDIDGNNGDYILQDNSIYFKLNGTWRMWNTTSVF